MQYHLKKWASGAKVIHPMNITDTPSAPMAALNQVDRIHEEVFSYKELGDEEGYDSDADLYVAWTWKNQDDLAKEFAGRATA